jgi:hypothetical protein
MKFAYKIDKLNVLIPENDMFPGCRIQLEGVQFEIEELQLHEVSDLIHSFKDLISDSIPKEDPFKGVRF